MALQREALEPRGIYEIKSRNLVVGVWSEDKDGFIGIREKFGSKFLFTEYLARECGGTQLGFDTAWPLRKVGAVSNDIELNESTGTICQICQSAAWWTGPPAPAPWECEGGCEDPRPVSVSNTDLYELLINYDDQILTERGWV